MRGHLFDELKPPAGRAVNAGNVSRAVAGAGHAIKRAEAEVEAVRKAVAKGTKGAVSPWPAGHAEQQLAEAEDQLRGRIGERNMTVRTIVDRVSRGDEILTSPGAANARRADRCRAPPRRRGRLRRRLERRAAGPGGA